MRLRTVFNLEDEDNVYEDNEDEINYQRQLGVLESEQERVPVGAGEPDGGDALDPAEEPPGGDALQLEVGRLPALLPLPRPVRHQLGEGFYLGKWPQKAYSGNVPLAK